MAYVGGGRKAMKGDKSYDNIDIKVKAGRN
jgi:hypothetical protein